MAQAAMVKRNRKAAETATAMATAKVTETATAIAAIPAHCPVELAAWGRLVSAWAAVPLELTVRRVKAAPRAMAAALVAPKAVQKDNLQERVAGLAVRMVALPELAERVVRVNFPEKAPMNGRKESVANSMNRLVDLMKY